MSHFLLAFSIIFLLVTQPVLAQEGDEIIITSPQAGQVVQGLAVVSGSVTVLGFSSYELAFSYEDDPTETWFTLHTSSLPVVKGELGTWDTTVLTDGDYSLRLRVFLLDGSFRDVTLAGLRVRNYTAIPTSTNTPTATAVVQFIVPTAQFIAPEPATATPSRSTPTPFPPNPAGLEIPSITSALTRGALLAFLLFLGVGILIRLRRG
jgi:hypothetical protein